MLSRLFLLDWLARRRFVEVARVAFDWGDLDKGVYGSP